MAAVIAMACRIALGGQGTYPGIVGIVLSAVAGIVVSWVTAGRIRGQLSVFILTATVFVLSIVLRYLFQAALGVTGMQMQLPVAFMNAVATATCA